MPDKRQHRGPHPRDRERFEPAHLPALRAAVADLTWLLGRSYSGKAALKLVGDRHGLDLRQRLAVQRATCSERARAARMRNRLAPDEAAGAVLLVDGFNVLTTVEAALAGGLVLHCRDDTFRDLASMHGTWRRVHETEPALQHTGATLAELSLREVVFFLDRPVSNSGRLRGILADLAERNGWAWRVLLVDSPDRELITGQQPVATADSAILDTGVRWLNLARLVVERHVPDAWIVDLASPDAPTSGRTSTE